MLHRYVLINEEHDVKLNKVLVKFETVKYFGNSDQLKPRQSEVVKHSDYRNFIVGIYKLEIQTNT